MDSTIIKVTLRIYEDHIPILLLSIAIVSTMRHMQSLNWGFPLPVSLSMVPFAASHARASRQRKSQTSRQVPSCRLRQEAEGAATQVDEDAKGEVCHGERGAAGAGADSGRELVEMVSTMVYARKLDLAEK